MLEPVAGAGGGKNNILIVAKLIDDEFRVGRDRVQASRSAQAFAGHVGKMRRDVLAVHGGDLRIAHSTRDRVRIDGGVVLLGGNLHSRPRRIRSDTSGKCGAMYSLYMAETSASLTVRGTASGSTVASYCSAAIFIPPRGPSRAGKPYIMSRGRLPAIQMNTGKRSGVYCSACPASANQYITWR